MRNKHQMLQAFVKVLDDYEKEHGKINEFCMDGDKPRLDVRGKPMRNAIFVDVSLILEAKQILEKK